MIKSKKVPGPAGGSSETPEPVTRSRSPTLSLHSLLEDAPYAKSLWLLRVLYKLMWRDKTPSTSSAKLIEKGNGKDNRNWVHRQQAGTETHAGR
ncbi:hypothetical protein EI94DRAFT_1743173 [Lactarius quietus]|nr:hypothetical protein EI94DRAFT_1743173 [Lactarius quietus]